MQRGRIDPSVIIFEEQLAVAGGFDISGQFINSIEIFKIGERLTGLQACDLSTMFTLPI